MSFSFLRKGTIAILLLFVAGAAYAAQPAGQLPANDVAQAQRLMSSVSANDLVRQVVAHELSSHEEDTYMYRDWRQTTSGSKTKEMVETRDGVVARLIAINDQPLTAEQRNAENARLQGLLNDPSLQAEKRKEQEQDKERVKRIIRETPNAFLYRYEKAQSSSSGVLIHMTFQPNPDFDPPSRETSVLRAMSGQMWVSATDRRLAKVEATLFRDVSFGWGILGRLHKGGYFVIEQTRISPNRWVASYMNLQFTGKALLFKTINLRQIEKLSNFRRVPSGLSLAQGIDMLNKSSDQLTEAAKR